MSCLPSAKDVCGLQRNRFDIDTHCAKEKAALSACASASVRLCNHVAYAWAWSPGCPLTLRYVSCRQRRQSYETQQTTTCRDYHACWVAGSRSSLEGQHAWCTAAATTHAPEAK